MASQMGCDLAESFFSNLFSHLFQSAAQRKGWTLVSFSHGYSHRVGNYSCLLSNTVLSLAIASILPEFFVHAVLFP